MKLKDIKPGKKYFRILATNAKDKITCKKIRQISTMYVVEVDINGKKVCASINRMPAEWFGPEKYSNWSETKPEIKHSKPLIQF